MTDVLAQAIYKEYLNACREIWVDGEVQDFNGLKVRISANLFWGTTRITAWKTDLGRCFVQTFDEVVNEIPGWFLLKASLYLRDE